MPNRIETRLVGPRNPREEKFLILEYAISFTTLKEQTAERIANRITQGMLFFIRDAQAHGLLPSADPLKQPRAGFDTGAAKKAAKVLTKKKGR